MAKLLDLLIIWLQPPELSLNTSSLICIMFWGFTFFMLIFMSILKSDYIELYIFLGEHSGVEFNILKYWWLFWWLLFLVLFLLFFLECDIFMFWLILFLKNEFLFFKSWNELLTLLDIRVSIFYINSKAGLL